MGNKTTKLAPKTIDQLKHHMGVDFSSDEIKEWYEHYRMSLTPGNTQLSREDFVRVYNKLFCGDATAFAEHVFRSFDKDRNGMVDFKEFVLGLYLSGCTDQEKKWDWAFSVYDVDGDGYITRMEMARIIQAILSMTDAHLPDNYKSVEQMTNEMFDKMDENGDDFISKDEFTSGARSNSFLVDLLECDPDGGQCG